MLLRIFASYPSPSLTDPPGSSVLVAAVSWLQDTVLGTVATSVAVVAVATIGFMMLMGRTNLRQGITVIAGCFVLFGATSIVAGIQATAESAVLVSPSVISTPAPPPPEAPPAPPPFVPANRDPYAGAAVPIR